MELVEQQAGGPDAWDTAFAAFHARFAPFFYRREVRERSARYLRGLLGPVERKNGWQLAEAVGETDPQGMQRLLYAARWDADAVRDELIRFVAEAFGDADGIFVVDETGFLKKGAKSVGVQRQYTGTAGKTENCQVGVFLTYVGPQGHAFLDRRLYLPESWAADAERRAAAAVPAEVTFQTKPALAWAMLEHAWTLGVPGRWVTADTVYGQDPLLRARLDGVAARRPVRAGGSRHHARLDRAPARCGDEHWQRASEPDLDGAHGGERDGGARAGWLAAHRRGRRLQRAAAVRLGGGAHGGRGTRLARCGALAADPPFGQRPHRVRLLPEQCPARHPARHAGPRGRRALADRAVLRREQRPDRAGPLRGAPLRQLAAAPHPQPPGAHLPGRVAAGGGGKIRVGRCGATRPT